MSRSLLSWKALALAMLAFVFLGAAVPTLVGENPAQPPALKAKVFRLKYCDPNEMEQVLQSLLDPNDPSPMPLNLPGPGGPPMGGVGMLGVGGVGVGAPGIPGGGLGALGVGGIGGFGGMPGAFQVSIDPRTRSVIVRASDKNLQLTADLISVLDLPKGKAMPEVKTLKALSLKHADAGEIMNALQAAGVEARMVALGEAKMLVVAGPEDAMKEVADLVKDLDVPTPPELKPEEQRKLFSNDQNPN
jgi:type II secretory pathway component GspD/PulD (secretin)